MNWEILNISLQGLKDHYSNGDFTPTELLNHLLQTSAEYSHKNIWIRALSAAELAPFVARLADKSPDDLPLFGVPFAIKDNIDLAGIPTTAACPAFAYTPQKSAFVVEQLIAAGAIPLGKTNLDQFATGLVGTRSPEPWGPCHNAFDNDYISGGSSSGSAVAVALGLASFSLGTDTAGSGRVPAALNNLIGLKPTKGLLSTTGVVPACRSLDVVSIFSLTASDVAQVFNVAAAYDPEDAFARTNSYANGARVTGKAEGSLKLGVPAPAQLSFFGDEQCEAVFKQNLSQWQALGAELVKIDFKPFLEAAALLYQGPWVTERYLAVRSLLEKNPAAIHPVVREIIAPGESFSAADLFESEYRLQALKRLADHVLSQVDLLITPTIGRQYTIDALLEDPVALNSNLGYYTNYMNLLDYSAIAVPGGFTDRGLPTGFTLVADKLEDQKLLAWAALWQDAYPQSPGAIDIAHQAATLTPFSDLQQIKVVVCGAHLDGLPLNWQLAERGGRLLEKTSSAANYRLYALADGKRPGMVRDEHSGAAIAVEVWSMPASEFGSFVAAIPAPLGIGKVELADGRWESGFICDGYGIEGATDITRHGGWRAYLETL